MYVDSYHPLTKHMRYYHVSFSVVKTEEEFVKIKSSKITYQDHLPRSDKSQ